MANVDDLLGETLVAVSGMEQYSDAVTFTTANGRAFRMYHSQVCCESVQLEEVVGDPMDLLNTPLLKAEELSNAVAGVIQALEGPGESYESCTWTFYHFGTIKGYVMLRWLGVSNGWYSESVDFEELR